MAVAFDKVTFSTVGFDNNSVTIAVTPVGTPRGVAVGIPQELATGDQVASITYGGAALGRVRRDVRTTTEACQVYWYFLGSGVPTGTQNCIITMNPASGCDDYAAAIVTLTGAADLEIVGQAGGDAGIIANPSLAISPTKTAVILYAFASGLAAPVATVESGSTHMGGNDYGASSAMWARKAVSAGATTIGYTAASDDVCHAAIAVGEVAAKAPPPFQRHTPRVWRRAG